MRKSAGGNAASFKGRRPGGDDLPYVFSGSLVVRGTGIAEVIAIGALGEIGKIGQSLSTLETEPPRLPVQTRRLMWVFALVGGPVSVRAVLLYGTLRGGWLDAVLAGIALGMSMLPAEFPVVLTVFRAMGAWRISRARVLTRRAAAIETLGSATVLCTDKTGTLTENRMSIAELRLKSGEVFQPREASGAKLPEDFHDLVEVGLLASARDPFDPMETAFHDFGREQLAETDHLHLQGSEWKLGHAYGLRPGLLAMSHVWQAVDGRQEFVIAAKGALPGDRQSNRPPGGHRRRRPRDRQRTRATERNRVGSARMYGDRVRADHAGTEAPYRYRSARRPWRGSCQSTSSRPCRPAFQRSGGSRKTTGRRTPAPARPTTASRAEACSPPPGCRAR